MPNLNWSQLAQIAEDAAKPLPAGTYTFKVHSAKWGTIKNGGAPRMNLGITVASGPFAGKTAFLGLNFDPAKATNLRISIEQLTKLGVNMEAFGEMSEKQQEDFLLGRLFEAQTEVREFNGNQNTDIRRVIRGIAASDVGASADFTPPPSQAQPDGPTEPSNPLADL